MGEEKEEKIGATGGSVAAPEKFSFNPAQWTVWKKRFVRYMSLSGTNEKSDENKLNCLIYHMGDRAEDIVLQFEENLSYEKTLLAFDNFFLPKRNVIFERFKFNSRSQQVEEPFEDFLTDLYKLSESCNYGSLKEELIRDRIVIGLKDKRTSERLQLKEDLQLKDAILIAKQAETQQKENETLRHSSAEETINKIRMKEHKQGKQSCWFCGGSRHPKDQCPAVKVKCFNCGRIGHFASLCRAKYMKRMEDDLQESAAVFKVGSCEMLQKYVIKMDVFSRDAYIDKLNFLIDTGADITAIPDCISQLQVTRCADRVKGPDGTPLHVKGTAILRLVYKEKVYYGKVYIIKGLKSAILGRPAIESMNIISICSMTHNVKNNSDMMESGSKVCVEKEFPHIFDELGVFKDKFSIKLIDNPQPYVQATPRNVSIPLLPKVKEELDKLERLGIISPIEEPTDFVSPIVVVYKNDKVRICGDYTMVNKNIKRPIYPIPKVENTLAQLKGAKYFSKMDATSGFHQIKLDEDSKKLTAIITPFGRYVYNRLPFGLNCAPEYFTMKFNNLFRDLKVAIHMDDILIYEENEEKHDKVLREVLKRLEKEGITINKDKCKFGVTEITYLGHIINENGIEIDPERIRAISEFKTPTNKKELLQFLGMVNFVGRFIPNKSHHLEPLHSLLRESNLFIWGMSQELAFREIKNKLQKSPTLAHFDPSNKIIVSADSSSYGLGAALMQEDKKGQRSIVVYASRTLTDTEKHYAQIEKECLALVWAIEKFRDYVIGIKVHLETDHKPLLQILQTKPLDDLTPRLLRFRLKLMRFDFEVNYTPGKDLKIADALSRNPLRANEHFERKMYLNLVFNLSMNESVNNEMLCKIKSEQEKSVINSKLIEYTVNGWPHKNKIEDYLRIFFQYRHNFTVEENLLLYNSRIVVPNTLQREILQKIHEGHLGITKCRERAKQSVWWMGLSKQIEEMVRNCPKCIEMRVNHKEDMIVDKIPDRAWQKIGIDLFKFKNDWYVVMVDYYSRFLEIFKLKDLTEDSVITKCKETFARYGIPEVVRTDCGTQFKSKFNVFAKEYGFKSVTSSPYYAQSNGQAESAVKIAKALLSKNDDIHLALLIYRNTPVECGYSPAELMFSRKLRDNLPIVSSKLNKNIDVGEKYKDVRNKKKKQDAHYYNKRHRVSSLPELNVNDKVWIIDLKTYGVIEKKCPEPRSFIVKTGKGLFRRNRGHLVLAPHANLEDVDYPFQEEVDVTPTSFLDSPEELPNFNNSQTEGNKQQSDTSTSAEGRESRRLVKRPIYLNDYVCD